MLDRLEVRFLSTVVLYTAVLQVQVLHWQVAPVKPDNMILQVKTT